MFTPALASMAALLMAQQAPAATTDNAQAAPPVATSQPLKAEKITDRSHPDYIRCKREPVIGSRAKFTKTCMTNSQWDQLAANGNRDARQIVDDLQVGSNSN